MIQAKCAANTIKPPADVEAVHAAVFHGVQSLHNAICCTESLAPAAAIEDGEVLFVHWEVDCSRRANVGEFTASVEAVEPLRSCLCSKCVDGSICTVATTQLRPVPIIPLGNVFDAVGCGEVAANNELAVELIECVHDAFKVRALPSDWDPLFRKSWQKPRHAHSQTKVCLVA